MGGLAWHYSEVTMDSLLNRREVEKIVGIGRSTIYRLMRAGAFPEPICVGPKAVRWRESEIEAYLVSRKRARGIRAKAA